MTDFTSKGLELSDCSIISTKKLEQLVRYSKKYEEVCNEYNFRGDKASDDVLKLIHKIIYS